MPQPVKAGANAGMSRPEETANMKQHANCCKSPQHASAEWVARAGFEPATFGL